MFDASTFPPLPALTLAVSVSVADKVDSDFDFEYVSLASDTYSLSHSTSRGTGVTGKLGHRLLDLVRFSGLRRGGLGGCGTEGLSVDFFRNSVSYLIYSAICLAGRSLGMRSSFLGVEKYVLSQNAVLSETWT